MNVVGIHEAEMFWAETRFMTWGSLVRRVESHFGPRVGGVDNSCDTRARTKVGGP